MKVLILTYPYCGGMEVGRSIASDCNYKFIYDPFEVRPLNYEDHNGDIHTLERGYEYGDVVEDNTLMVQNVGWHPRNPQNLDHTPFLNGLRGRFNRVFCLMTDHIEFNWKLYCSSEHREDGENYWWKKWNLENCYEYKEEHFNSSHKSRIINAHNTLSAYKDLYNLPVIKRENIFPQHDGEESENLNLNPAGLNSMFEALDIGMPEIDLEQPSSAFYQCLRNGWENKF